MSNIMYTIPEEIDYSIQFKSTCMWTFSVFSNQKVRASAPIGIYSRNNYRIDFSHKNVIKHNSIYGGRGNSCSSDNCHESSLIQKPYADTEFRAFDSS